MLNIERTRKYLQDFDFKTLFIEELGWSKPKNNNAITFKVKEEAYFRKAISELSGAVVYEISTEEGVIPDSRARDLISKEIQKINFEHILIFLDIKRTQSIWRWLKKQDKKNLPREHYFSKGQTGDLFISKLSGLLVDLSEIENDITIIEVAKKIQTSLDIEHVTKKFFRDYQSQYITFLELIEGIDNDSDQRWYASVILNRLMFIYFLQKKLFLDNGNERYLSDKLQFSKDNLGKNKFYDTFLNKLFFEGFAKEEDQRDFATNKLIGKVKYLNGGLFLKHKIEEKYSGKIKISDAAFENLFGLFDSYSWSLDDTPGGKDDEINPDVLGYIFEKYINQKSFGAYYTRTEITEYLCEQTVYKLILDEVNESIISPDLLKKSGLDKFDKPKHFETIADLLLNLDAPICNKLIVGQNAVLPNLSLLDPACGSGAFLIAAMKTLINVYAAILGKIDFLGDKKLIDWKKEIEQNHPSINYFIKKQIITNNLYGVDIMEEATEIAKLRLFLALVASAQTVDQLEPLPNIDFNIMYGNSLIGMMRVDPNQFNQQLNHPSRKQIKGKVVRESTLFQPGLVQGNIFADEHAKNYQQLINEKESAIQSYKNAHKTGITELQNLRDEIQESEQKANEILNNLLLEEFNNLGIKYEQVTWDKDNNKEGKSVKRPLDIHDIKALEPFHWGYEFSDIYRKKNGFDAIITNPPWEVFQTDEKEFFHQYDNQIKKKKLRIEDWQKQMSELMLDTEIKTAWLSFASKYPFQSSYFKKSEQYMKLLSGKLNLYTLFTIQCYNLLKKDGYCGIVIPSGIYSDLGAHKLRKLLFENSKVTGIFSFENRKEIFEGVHRSFKFSVLSFEKGQKTIAFPAAFMRHDVSELSSFPQYGASNISLDFIRKQSPDSYSVMEMKNELDFSIAEKLLQFPFLNEKISDVYNIELYSEYNMTTDSHLFQNKPGNGLFPLYEGKMIWQFSHLYAEPRYWISEKQARAKLLGSEKDICRKLEYQKYRICFRDITSPTNERTMINSILPKNVFAGNTLALSKENSSNSDKLLIVALLNSFINDYAIRQKITSHCNFFYVNQLRVPRLKPKDMWYKPIIERSARLICTTQDFSELWEEVMQNKWSIDISAFEEEERNQLRAELDGIIAHIYGLSDEEFSYILSTFPIVEESHKVKSLNYFRKVVSQANLETADSVKWLNIIKQGENSILEFKSTLRIDLKSGKPEKFIEHSVLKTMAAFLNSDGGTLLIGVDDAKNILGLETDFNSFSKPDKLDEFQKHFDNLIAKSLGNKCYHYLKVEIPLIEDKMICAVTIKSKSSEPVYITDEKGQESFYIRRLASTVELKPSEAIKYIRDHF